MGFASYRLRPRRARERKSAGGPCARRRARRRRASPLVVRLGRGPARHGSAASALQDTVSSFAAEQGAGLHPPAAQRASPLSSPRGGASLDASSGSIRSNAHIVMARRVPPDLADSSRCPFPLSSFIRISLPLLLSKQPAHRSSHDGQGHPTRHLQHGAPEPATSARSQPRAQPSTARTTSSSRIASPSTRPSPGPFSTSPLTSPILMAQDAIGLAPRLVPGMPDVCAVCGVDDTPEWRKGPAGYRSLCNGCGIVYARRLKADEADGVVPASTVEEIERELEAIGLERFKVRRSLPLTPSPSSRVPFLTTMIESSRAEGPASSAERDEGAHPRHAGAHPTAADLSATAQAAQGFEGLPDAQE